jgi:hypothetical protein
MYLLHYIYLHFQLKCKYTTKKIRYFQLVKMNYELRSSTSIDINESQAKI